LALCAPRFLGGEDRCSGQSFEHRRQCSEDRLQQLAEVFALSLWPRSVMGNQAAGAVT